MSKSRNYILPLGEFKGRVHDRESEWVWIHQERIRHGLNSAELGELAGVNSTTVSRGERGIPVSLTVTRKVLKVLGARLVFVTEDGVQHEA